MTYLAFPDQEMLADQTVISDDARLFYSTHPPVFLHCGWRTRGTWIWNRFREMPGVTGYYEPLGEGLARLQPNTLATMHARSWPSGHTGLHRPYFEEFRPLLRSDRPGVRGYQPHFATSDFFAAPDKAMPELSHYLRGLLHAARERGEQPVLKFCRSIGRVGWMRQHFPDAVHIVVLRDPFTQFASALRQYVRHGNADFLSKPLLLLALHRDLPLIGRCARQLGVALPNLAGARSPLEVCEASLRAGDPASWYRGFLAFWTATVATLPDNIELVIDSEALAHSAAYRLECGIALARLSGREVDFSDADRSGDTEKPDAPLLRGSEVLRVHAAAESFLAEQLGPAWADMASPGLAARLLAEARARALGSHGLSQTGRLIPRSRPEADPESTAALLSGVVRAAWAERELAAVLASRSWKVTAPIRWLRRRLN